MAEKQVLGQTAAVTGSVCHRSALPWAWHRAACAGHNPLHCPAVKAPVLVKDRLGNLELSDFKETLADFVQGQAALCTYSMWGLLSYCHCPEQAKLSCDMTNSNNKHSNHSCDMINSNNKTWHRTKGISTSTEAWAPRTVVLQASAHLWSAWSEPPGILEVLVVS